MLHITLGDQGQHRRLLVSMGPDSILTMDVPESGYGAGPVMLLTRQHSENLAPKKIAEAFCDPRCALSSSAPPDLGHALAAVCSLVCDLLLAGAV